jgi:hypothetical protein
LGVDDLHAQHVVAVVGHGLGGERDVLLAGRPDGDVGLDEVHALTGDVVALHDARPGGHVDGVVLRPGFLRDDEAFEDAFLASEQLGDHDPVEPRRVGQVLHVLRQLEARHERSLRRAGQPMSGPRSQMPAMFSV